MIPQKTAERLPESSIHDDDAAPHAWLEQWQVARRSLISNLFHNAVRAGASTSALIITAVQAELRWRSARPPLDATDETLHAVLKSLQTAPQEAYPYAEGVIAWERLPYTERERQKQARGRHFQQQYMAAQPVTDKQLRYLQLLGYAGDAPANRVDASALIDGLLSARRKGQP